MNKDEVWGKEHRVLVCLCSLPRRILSLSEKENSTEFVLHNLCDQDCFNWDRAAYFVDNPDFDCLKGIAGYSKAESYVNDHSIWDNPHEFSIHMEASHFNQKVKNWLCSSCKKNNDSYQSIVNPIARELSFENYGIYDWDIKYGNHAVLIYEKPTEKSLSEEHIRNGIYFLGLCPLF